MGSAHPFKEKLLQDMYSLDLVNNDNNWSKFVSDHCALLSVLPTAPTFGKIRLIQSIYHGLSCKDDEIMNCIFVTRDGRRSAFKEQLKRLHAIVNFLKDSFLILWFRSSHYREHQRMLQILEHSWKLIRPDQVSRK